MRGLGLLKTTRYHFFCGVFYENSPDLVVPVMTQLVGFRTLARNPDNERKTHQTHLQLNLIPNRDLRDFV